jgi:hypothetical protein
MKEQAKLIGKTRRKAEYSKEGMTVLERWKASNRGKAGEEINPITANGAKRGFGRGKARDAGPPRKDKSRAPKT